MKNGGLLSKMRAFWVETSGLFIVSGRVSFWGTRCLSHSAASYAIPAHHSPIAYAKAGHVNDNFGVKARFDAKECFLRKPRSERKWSEAHLCRANPCRSSYSIEGEILIAEQLDVPNSKHITYLFSRKSSFLMSMYDKTRCFCRPRRILSSKTAPSQIHLVYLCLRYNLMKWSRAKKENRAWRLSMKQTMKKAIEMSLGANRRLPRLKR